ncbi:MAG: FAD binding domain-containing protein, partial [Phycisphaerae bacterium]
MTEIEEYHVPRTLEELTRILADREAVLLAGGTDLMPQFQAGNWTHISTLINIRRIFELYGITESDGVIRIGALTTITAIRENELLREKADVLSQAADCFAGTQIRNIATIGGNICHASPAADMVIPLLLLNAELRLASWSDGRVTLRSMPLCDFFVAPGETRLRAGEVLKGIEFQVPDPAAVGVFRKLGTRPALDIAVVSVGILGIKDNGSLRDVRAAFGAVAPTPFRGRVT